MPKTRFALPHRCIRQLIRFGIILPRHVRDGKTEGSSQFAASPMQRVEARTTADVLAAHLPNHNLRVRVNVQRLGLQRQCALQRLEQRHIFGNVVILVADPPRDADRAAGAAIDDHPDTRWPRIAQGTTVHIGHEF